jgi:hypothetical protein
MMSCSFLTTEIPISSFVKASSLAQLVPIAKLACRPNGSQLLPLMRLLRFVSCKKCEEPLLSSGIIKQIHRVRAMADANALQSLSRHSEMFCLIFLLFPFWESMMRNLEPGTTVTGFFGYDCASRRLLQLEFNMPLRIFIAVLTLVAILAPWALAESTDCSTPVIIIPDGRITQSSFPQAISYWYGVYALAQHSYSVEFEPPADNYPNNSHPRFAPITVFSPTDFLQNCRGNASVAVTPNGSYAPTIASNSNGTGRRISFTAQYSGLYLMQVTNSMGTGTYTFRAIDTTLVNVRWNTMGNDVQWILMNVSDMPITGTMTLNDMNGQIVSTTQVSIPRGGRVSRTTGPSDLNLARGLAGSAIFSHNGPPNSVIAEAFLLTPVGPVAEKFDAVAPR